MTFGPPPRFPIGQLRPASPSLLTPPTLRTQLEAVGLNCAEITDASLEADIQEVKAVLPQGVVQSYVIAAPLSSPAVPASKRAIYMVAVADIRSERALLEPMVDVATGNWEPDVSAQGYNKIFYVIANESHFNWLYDNRATNHFTGVKNEPPAYTGYYSNAEAIKKLFVQVCLTASSTLVQGLDRSTMEAVLWNIIQPMDDSQLANYDQPDSRIILLVQDYDPSTQTAEGVGFVYMNWHLKVQDYKRKTKHGGDTHDTYLLVKAGANLYFDYAMCDDYKLVCDHFGISNRERCPVPTGPTTPPRAH